MSDFFGFSECTNTPNDTIFGYSDPKSQNGSTNGCELQQIGPSATGSLPNQFEISPFPTGFGIDPATRLNKKGIDFSQPEIIITNPFLPAVLYYPDSLVFNTSGENLHYIFCHETFMSTCNFKCPPSRKGTKGDARLLVKAFDLYGFRSKIYYDMKYDQIIDIISRVSHQNHTGTSCLWVTILTHAKGNKFFAAADRPYKLSQIEILLQSENLAGKPKILMIPCIRGGNEMPGFNSRLPPQNDREWWNQVSDEEQDCTVCGNHNVDDGIVVQCAEGNTIVLPRTSNFLFLHTTNNDLASFSIVIRAICEVFEEHEELDPPDLAPFVNHKVENNSDHIGLELKNWLRKSLRLTRTNPHRY